MNGGGGGNGMIKLKSCTDCIMVWLLLLLLLFAVCSSDCGLCHCGMPRPCPSLALLAACGTSLSIKCCGIQKYTSYSFCMDALRPGHQDVLDLWPRKLFVPYCKKKYLCDSVRFTGQLCVITEGKSFKAILAKIKP